MNYAPENILEGAPNARDLGGMRTLDGGVFRPSRVIRSGPISKITDADAAYLEEHGLRTVIDLRTEQEKYGRLDVILDGVSYIDCPIIESRAIGITHELPRDDDGLAQYYVVAAADINARGGGRALMRKMYEGFITNPYAVEHYRQFFDFLLQNEEGCVLYHCTMGKDRVGCATAMLLTALGVSREDIVEDYMYTKTRLDGKSQEMLARCRKFTSDEAILDTIYQMDTVDESYIGAVFSAMEAQCGTAEKYVREALGVTPEKRDRLKKLYLE
jgi:protein-tyrosine phosphatase